MPPLITREEATRLGEIEDHAQIEALVERAWAARVERFADSTDMRSLVNAKSGGCAEDCGFCAQSRFAEAETPMHAMMNPEQVLEHARAAEAAGAHRFCMVTQGQGLSKRDFEKYLEGVRLVGEHTNLKRCASIGHISQARAAALREAGIQRVHHNVETAASYYDEVTTTVRYEGRLRTIQAVREAGLNGVMMGSFLTTLGAEPAEDRAMFEQHGLNVARQPDNAVNARPDNRSGWLSGETPDVVQELLGEHDAGSAAGNAAPDQESALRVRLWDPSTQLRYRAKRAVPPRPDGSPNSAPAARARDERGPRREDSALAPAATAAGWGD